MFALQFELQLCNNCSQSQSTQRTSLRQWHYDEYSGNFCQHCIVCVEFWLIICIYLLLTHLFSCFLYLDKRSKLIEVGKKVFSIILMKNICVKYYFEVSWHAWNNLRQKSHEKLRTKYSKVFPLVWILGISDCHLSSVAFKCLWNEKVLFYFYEIKVSFLCLFPFMHE